MEETIEGYVGHIIFRNEENGYTVMVVVAEEEEITCVGSRCITYYGNCSYDGHCRM